MNMRAILLALAVAPLGLYSVSGLAAGGGGGGEYWEQPTVRMGDTASMQRGARLFANYCMGCHEAQYHRWMHVAEDLNIPESVVQENLIWLTDEVGQKLQVGTLMENSMTEEYGAEAFGGAPPDLTLATRLHGADWVYNFLRTFYVEEGSPTGVNNAVLAGASMPHVLGNLQGYQRPVHDDHGDIVDFELVREGSMSPAEYDRAVNDIVNFMAYLAEPARLERVTIGIWVMVFLLVFLVVAYLLKKEYWKDVH